MAENHNKPPEVSEEATMIAMQVAFGKYLDAILGPWERQMLQFIEDAPTPGDKALRVQVLLQGTAFVAEKARYMAADYFSPHQTTKMVAAGMNNLADRTDSALSRKTGIINPH